ncbi:BamA/TamA family outer membrane protein [Pseudogemmobacter sp. W21_MBD1_M6]|uniref:BamA/TamA family outer membrane protein n=1 Tax=Pseudogemmobacter sp. W21_MBD1_M6 TaxID=3240271 RepID=UPI003F9AAA73
MALPLCKIATLSAAVLASVLGLNVADRAWAQNVGLDGAYDADVPDPMDKAGDAPVGSISAGLGYSSDIGGNVSLGFTRNRFLGRDQSLRFGVNIAKDDRRFSLDFRNNNMFGGSPAFGVGVSYVDTRATDTFRFDTKSFRIRPSLTWHQSDEVSIQVFARFSHDVIENVDAATSKLIRDDEGSRNATGIGGVLSYDFGVASATFSAEGVATNDSLNYLKTTFRLETSNEIAGGRVALGAALKGGMLFSQKGDIGIGDRFFVGAGDVRGFAFAGIGPRDLNVPGTASLGGKTFVSARLDARLPQVFGAEAKLVPGVFVDAGSLWGLDRTGGGAAGLNAVDDGFHLRSSAGLTIQYDLGIGMIQLSVAEPVKKQSYDKTQQFQVSFSTVF